MATPLPATPDAMKRTLDAPAAPLRPHKLMKPNGSMTPQELKFEESDRPAARSTLPYYVIVLLKDYYELESRLVQHMYMAAYNVNRCRHHVHAEEKLGTWDYEDESMDPRMYIALNRKNAMAMRYCMWKLVDEHMKLLATLNLVCKDMNIAMDISILGGNSDLDLNTRSLGIRLFASMFSDTIVPNDPFPGQTEASERIYVKYLEKFERRVYIHNFDNPVSFASLKMLYEDIATFMVEKADEYHDLMGVGRFCQHDKLIELIEWGNRRDLAFPAYGITPENYSHFCYFSLHSIYGKHWPDGSYRVMSPTTRMPHHRQEFKDDMGVFHPVSKSIQGLDYDQDRFVYKQCALQPQHSQRLSPPYCDYCRQMPWGAHCKACEDRSSF